MRFITIAQPFYFPIARRSGVKMLLLIVLLLIFIFGVLFMIIGSITLLFSHYARHFVSEVAPGLSTVVADIFHSAKLFILIALIIIPVVVFSLFGRHLLAHKTAWLLLAIVLFLSLAVTAINVSFSYIGNYFTNALVKKNQEMAYIFVGVYFCGFLIGIPIVAFYSYVQNYLGMKWREWMTSEFLGNYFKNRKYYEIEASSQIDNPDQRIVEDIRSFTRTSLTFFLIVLGSVMDLVSFSGILWSKSILLVIVVLGYSLLGTLFTVLIGRRLVRLNFNQLRYEADFRYSLVHVRDNTESIAFYQGEKPEQANIAARFREVLRNFGLLIGWQRNLSFYTTTYSYLPVVLPFIILLPKYFGGKIQYGDMVQANFAFTQVYTALSLIVSQIEQITNFAAGVERLSTFAEAIKSESRPVAGIISEESNRLVLSNITLLTPNKKRTLLRELTMDLANGDNLVVVGRSGVGKSSLLRAIAGLWTQGYGVIKRQPLANLFFLPQKPYMLLGSLRDQLLYPHTDKVLSEEQLIEVLKVVRLEDLPERVGGFDSELEWSDVLSIGEQQRLAFARLLINQPSLAVLDEATSSMGLEDESNLYAQLNKFKIQYISVGHRTSLLEYHNRVLELQGQNKWKLMSVDEYRELI